MSDDPVSEAELLAIEARVRAASPEPWHSWIEGRDACGGEDVVTTANGEFYFRVRTYLEDRPLEENRQQSAADQDFIAHARADVPRLIAEICRLRALPARQP
jgi:hypothetical protein